MPFSTEAQITVCSCRVDRSIAEEVVYGYGHQRSTVHARRSRTVPRRYPIEAKWQEIEEHWLAVEVLSRSSRVYDHEIKRDAYIALGLQEVWLVDRWSKLVEVSRRRGPGTITDDVLRWHIPTNDIEVPIPLSEVFAGL